MLSSFNPRARVGRDQQTCGRLSDCACFNPRARVGRDQTQLRNSCPHNRFNPRARVGRDSFSTRAVGDTSMFQSTRPRGARLERRGLLKRRLINVFQSTRPRGARRVLGRDFAQCILVSIHAPAWGAT